MSPPRTKIRHAVDDDQVPFPTIRMGGGAGWGLRLQRMKFESLTQAPWILGRTAPAVHRVEYLLQAYQSQAEGMPVIKVVIRTLKKNGRFGARWELKIATSIREQSLEPEDHEILTLLAPHATAPRHLPHAHGAHLERGQPTDTNEAIIPPHASKALIARMAKTGRLYLDGEGLRSHGEAITWEGGDPWLFRLRIETGMDVVKMRGELVRGEEALNLDATFGLFSSGVVLHGATAAVFDTRGAMHWVKDLEYHGPLVVPKAQWSRLRENLALTAHGALGDSDFAVVTDVGESSRTIKEVTDDAGFLDYRARLEHFIRVTPRQEPRTFEGELRAHQRLALGWFRFLRDVGLGGALADEMGLGKKVQVLALLEERRASRETVDGSHRPTLLVVPRSLVATWMTAVGRFTPKLRAIKYAGAAGKARAEQMASCDLIVTSYGALRRNAARLAAIEFDYVVLDEATAIKNSSSQVALAAQALRGRHRIAILGAAIEYDLDGLWSVFDFLNPGMVHGSAACKRLARRGQGPGPVDLTMVAEALGPIVLRRTRKDVTKDDRG